jgi:hypothetical protein
MPESICVIHSVPSKQTWRKDDPEHKGSSWYSHKTDDPNYPSGWCNGKPSTAPAAVPARPQVQPTQVKEFNGRSNEFWDKRGRQIAMCGLANAMLSSGVAIEAIDVAKLSVLLNKIEHKAEELTLDENGPGF